MRGFRWWTGILGVLLVTVITIQAVLLVNQHHPWAPLAVYDTQSVTSRIPSINGPAAHLGGTVDVTATKCNTTSQPVKTRGSTFWQATYPDGSNTGLIITGVTGIGTRVPGCHTHHFHNPIPPDVAAAVRAGNHLWVIAGTETPFRRQGEGVPRVWSTEPFTLIP